MPRAAYAAVEAEFLTTNHRSEGETYYSYDTETGKVGTEVDNINSEYEGVGLKKMAQIIRILLLPGQRLHVLVITRTGP